MVLWNTTHLLNTNDRQIRAQDKQFNLTNSQAPYYVNLCGQKEINTSAHITALKNEHITSHHIVDHIIISHHSDDVTLHM